MTPSPTPSKKTGGCLLFFLTILGLLQIVLAFRVLEDSALYGELSIAPPIQIGISLIWLVIIIWSALAVYRRQAYGFGINTIIAYLVVRLLEVVLFAQADYDRNRTPFLLLVMVLLLLIPLLRWILRSGTQNERG